MAGRVVSIRRYVEGQDDPLWVDLRNRALAEYPEITPETLRDFEIHRRGPWHDPTGMMIAEIDGMPAGCSDAWIDRNATEDHGYFEGPWVVPEHRRKGVGTALAQAVLESLRRRGRASAQLWQRDNPRNVAFAESLGFRRIRIFHAMSHDLNPVPHSVGECRDAAIVEMPGDDATIELVNRLDNEAFKEHFNHRPVTLAESRHMYEVSRERDEWLFTLVARLEGRPVGFLVGGSDPTEVAHRGRGIGGLYILGVLKPFRNRGVAKALLISGLERLKERGMIEAELGVDTENVTGALHLYERLGFRSTRRRLTWLKEL